MELSGRTAVVTGASRGIGRALALALAAAGMDVVVAATGPAPLEAVADEVRALGVAALPVVCDVSSEGQVLELAEHAFGEFGTVHVLCNNAGVTTIGGFDEQDLSDWEWVHRVVVMGVVHGIRAFLPRMIEQGAGQILTIGSQAGLVPDGWLNHGPYIPAKAAVTALSVALRAEVAPHGVGVSLLIPGGVQTGILASHERRPSASCEGERSAIVARPGAPPREPETPRWLDPEDVAAIAVAGLARDDAFIMTHPGYRPLAADYFTRILAAYDRLGG